MRTHHWQGDVYDAWRQFYIWDGELRPPAPTEYTREQIEQRIIPAPNVVMIATERDSSVPVDLEVHDRDPKFAAAEWEHIAEASLELTSSKLEIHECAGPPITELKVAPGTYRVRLHCNGLGTVDGYGEGGRDSYFIALWPAPMAPVKVVKQFRRSATK
jgi:hypothetical protein